MMRFKRAGYAEAAEAVQALWVSGDKAAAIRAVPDEMVLKNQSHRHARDDC